MESYLEVIKRLSSGYYGVITMLLPSSLTADKENRLKFE